MTDVTNQFQLYREHARHLWNGFFFPQNPTFDDVDVFDRIRAEMFAVAFVFDQSSAHAKSQEKAVLAIGLSSTLREAPIAVQRPSDDGNYYWDDPVKAIRSNKDNFLEFVDLFDWDLLSARDFQFVKVKIAAWEDQAHLIGRYALLQVQHCRVFSPDF